MKLEGARVVVTGASSGLGWATAKVLAGRGARLTLAARRPHCLQELAAEIGSSVVGWPPTAVPCDVSRAGDVRDLVEKAIRHMGGIDVFINNAGISVYGDAESIPVEVVREVMDVNFFGPLHSMLEVVPVMRRQGSGLIVNVASVAALRGVPYLSAYGAAKSALAAWSQSLRAELAGTGVEILMVYPDYTETPLFRKERKWGAAHRPLGPYESPMEVAGAIVSAMETGKRELVMSARGKGLAMLSGTLPPLVDRLMAGLAGRLRGREVELRV